MTAALSVVQRNGRHAPVPLVDLTLPQLAEAAHGLERLEQEYENMSGICATLKGLVLIEAKRKPELKGRFKQWVIETFPKSYKTATSYMRMAEAFVKSESTFTFQTLTRDLASSLERLREFQLDLSHPVVAKVAAWAKGRGCYQLMLEFSGSAGGDTSWSREKLSPEEERKQAIEKCREESVEAFNGVYRLGENERWKFGMTDAELELAADAMRELAREISGWLKLPAKQRRTINLEAVIP